MVVVRMTEMYDMATTKGKIGIIGIHTPTTSGMAKRWKGLFDNHRYYKILGCDIKIACASILPADPLQVGVESGDVAPQDMMNPLLYTTMTNDGWNALINRLYATGVANSVDTGSIKSLPVAFANMTDAEQEALYYQMLSSDRFRKAMPQNGLNMSNVKPLVHEVYTPYGAFSPANQAGDGVGTQVIGVDINGAPTSTGTVSNRSIRGRSRPYPRIPCSLPGSTPGTGDYPLPQGVPLLDVFTPYRSYVACVVLPPAKLHEFYFRMLITWRIEFIKPCTILEKLQPGQLGDTTDIYLRTYTFTSAKDIDPDMLGDDDRVDSVASVDALNMAPELVMEK